MNVKLTSRLIVKAKVYGKLILSQQFRSHKAIITIGNMSENGVYLHLICNAWGEGGRRSWNLRSISKKQGSENMLNPH